MITESADLLCSVPLLRACALLDLNRGSIYRARALAAAAAPITPPHPHGPTAADGHPGVPTPTANRSAPAPPVIPPGSRADGAVLAEIERLVTAFPGYGYRRVTRQLQRDGWEVNHKRVRRLMAAAGLLCRRRRRFIRTTDSRHSLPVFPNLLADRGWRQLTALNQAWVADLTYVRLGEGFCYLAVLLDAFSRRVVGWALRQSLDAGISLAALEQALTTRQPAPGWIHHSDRGVQYACHAYVDRLRAAGARISMTAVGAPRENAQAERFMRTIKEEEVDLQDYRNAEEARSSIGNFIRDVYNGKRLHSALGYLPPSEFEERYLTSGTS